MRDRDLRQLERAAARGDDPEALERLTMARNRVLLERPVIHAGDMVGLSPDGQIRAMEDGDEFMGVAGVYTQGVAASAADGGAYRFTLS